MAKPPVTRMQLDAYRFSQRRLESALALRDPVLLHEQIRTQRRTSAVGLAAAVLLACGLMAYVHLTGTRGWAGATVIQNSQSGQMYVVGHRPDRLVPVANLAAARLVLAAAPKPDDGLGGLVGGDSPADANPISMAPAQLAGAPFTAGSPLVGAPDTNLPGGDTPSAPSAAWALCADTRTGDTEVVDGVGPTEPLGPRDGLVVAAHGANYLVTGDKKYRIGPGAAAAYDLKDAMVDPPNLPDAVFARIPAGNDLGGLTLNLTSARAAGTRGSTLGEVVGVVRPGQGTSFYVLTQDGAALVSEPMAKMLRAGRGEDLSQPAAQMSPDQVNGLRRATLSGLDQYPNYLPAVRPATGAVCWQWDVTGEHPRVTTARSLPTPPTQPPTRLAQADGPGPKLDAVSVPGGAAIVLSSVPGPGSDATRRYWLVSTTGVGYPIADIETARALGVSAPVAAPADALAALVQGHPLDLAEAAAPPDGPRRPPPPG